MKNYAPFAVIAAFSLIPAAAIAADYNYLEGGFIDRHDYGRSGAGGRVAGSFDLNTVPVAVIAEFAGTHHLNQFDAGAVLHTPVNRTLDLFGGATLEHGDRSDDSDTGVGLRAGLRWRASGALELAPEFRYVHLFGEDQASVRLGALVALAPSLQLQGAVQVGDDQRYELGLRYAFGRLR